MNRLLISLLLCVTHATLAQAQKPSESKYRLAVADMIDHTIE
jgi:hypothetical protein